MDKKERYINFIVDDLLVKTNIIPSPMKINVGGIWSAYPAHFVDYKKIPHSASIFTSFKDKLIIKYGINDGEFRTIVDRLYPILVNYYNLSYHS
jgi:hypothetical protein